MEKVYQVAKIEETTCIGCTKCIQVCPVDAILGAPQKLHSILTELCIGCQLCLPPCPVDCISLLPYPMTKQERSTLASKTKKRVQARKLRITLKAKEKKKNDEFITAHLSDIMTAVLEKKQIK